MKTKLSIMFFAGLFIGLWIGLLIGLLRPAEIQVIREYYFDQTKVEEYRLEVERLAGLMKDYQDEAEAARQKAWVIEKKLTGANFKVSWYEATTGKVIEVRVE